MKILALDIGTKTGWCCWENNHLSLSTEVLATKKEVNTWGKERLDRRCDPRIERMARLVRKQMSILGGDSGHVDWVVFEDVEFASSRKQAHLWASLRAAIWLTAAPVKIECVPVGTLKAFATGHGGATKEMMMKAVQLWNPERFAFRKDHVLDYNTNSKLDDNACDALHLARWAKLNLARAKT